MARKTKAAATPEPEETEETTGAVRGPSEMHELFSEWLKDEYDADVTPEAIFWVTSKRTAFRKSDVYAEFAEKQEQEREERLAEKEKRAQEREAAKVSKDEDGDEDEAPKTSRRRKAKTTEDEEPAAEAPKPTRSRRKPAAKQADEDTEPEEKPAARPARRRRSAPAGAQKAPF